MQILVRVRPGSIRSTASTTTVRTLLRTAAGRSRWFQQNNRRDNHLLTIHDRTHTLVEWAREANIRPGTLYGRIKDGWEPEWALVPLPGMLFWEGGL